MICPTCGANNAEGAAFCYNCSNPLPQVPQGWTTPPPPGVPPVPPAPPPQPPSYPPAYQPAVGGQPPVKPPGRMNAGIAGLIAFVAVLAIGLVVFFLFVKGGGSPKAAPTTQAVGTTTPAPTTTTPAPTTSAPPPTISTTSEVPISPPPTRSGGTGPKMVVLACSKISAGKCVGSNGELEPPFHRLRSDPRMVVFVIMLNVPANVNLSATILDASTGSPVVSPFTCTTTGASPFECRFHITAPPGGFPAVTLEVVFRVNGTVVNPDNAPRGVVIRFV